VRVGGSIAQLQQGYKYKDLYGSASKRFKEIGIRNNSQQKSLTLFHGVFLASGVV